MSAAQWIGAGLLAGGAVAGSVADTARAIEPPRAGAYHVLEADFHVHAFPGDGVLPAWEISHEASRRGLHAVVVSNHNQTRAARFVRGGEPAFVIPSQEVTTPKFHIVAVGVTQPVDWRLPGADLIRAIHAQGGVAIAAHPVRTSWKGGDDMLPLLDGIEVAHPMTKARDKAREDLTAFFTRVKAVNPTIAPIGSSDFHMVRPMAICRTFVFAESVSIAGVLDAIRAGRTVAEDPEGVRYGDPLLTGLLEHREGGRSTPGGPHALRLMSIAMALMGVFALVLLR